MAKFSLAGVPSSCVNDIESFLSIRTSTPFKSKKDFHESLTKWDSDFIKSILPNLQPGHTKEKLEISKGLMQRIPYRQRVQVASNIDRTRTILLEETTNLQMRFPEGSSENLTISQAIDSYSRSLRQRTIPLEEKHQLKQLDKFESTVRKITKESGFDGINSKKIEEAHKDFIVRIEGYKKIYGAEHFPEETVLSSGFNVLGGHLFLSIANLPIRKQKALDAISLLDPLTDDALDKGLDVMSSMKKITKILAGSSIEPENSYEKVVFGLIAEIFDAYPMNEYPTIQWALQELHHTQLQSIKLQRDPSITFEEISKLTIRKGGLATVLAANIAFQRLSKNELEFFYRLGGVFQVADDFVDIEKDLVEKTFTIWTKTIHDRGKITDPLRWWLHSQAKLEELGLDKLKGIHNFENIIQGISFGHKMYLMGGYFKSLSSPAVQKVLGNRFPLDQKNLKKVYLGIMANLNLTGEQRNQILKVIDHNVFDDLFTDFSKKSAINAKDLLSMNLPIPYKAVNGINNGYFQLTKKMFSSSAGAYIYVLTHFLVYADTFYRIDSDLFRTIIGIMTYYSFLKIKKDKDPTLFLATFSLMIYYTLYEDFYVEKSHQSPEGFQFGLEKMLLGSP